MNATRWTRAVDIENVTREGNHMKPRKPHQHVLCGTCSGEYDRGRNDRGLQEGLKGRAVLKHVPVEAEADDLCCVCGQISAPDKRFIMSVADLPHNWCKGQHPNLRAAHGKCDCGRTTAFEIWDFVGDAADVDATCLKEGCGLKIELVWTDDEG